jgi:hypothetical protein
MAPAVPHSFAIRYGVAKLPKFTSHLHTWEFISKGLIPKPPNFTTFSALALMAPKLRASTNAQGLKTAASTGNKRKRDETPDSRLKTVPKKRKGRNTIDAVPDRRTAFQKAVIDRSIIKEFRITFHPRKFYPERPGDVPEQHQTKFKHIQQLGQMKYESYAVQPRPDIVNKPWELDNKLRASRVSQKAIESRQDNQNEGGWRMELENRIFERFEIEVAWYATLTSFCSRSCMLMDGSQQCRKRLWQSFVQVNPSESNSHTVALAERQKRRSVCDCEPLSKQYSM